MIFYLKSMETSFYIYSGFTNIQYNNLKELGFDFVQTNYQAIMSNDTVEIELNTFDDLFNLINKVGTITIPDSETIIINNQKYE